MSDAYVIGIGVTPFGIHVESNTDLGTRAVLAAIADAGLAPGDVDAVYAGHVYGGMVAGERVAADCALARLPIVNVENACASGTTAVIEAAHAVRSGRFRCVVACGFEKISELKGMIRPADSDYEGQLGLVFPAWHAMRARMYMERHDLTREQLALVAVKAHRNGARNPIAQRKHEITVEQVADSREIASPLQLLDCCPKGDGGAAVIVASEQFLAESVRRHGRAVKIAGMGLYSGGPDGTYDPLFEDVTARAAETAYADARITPDEIEFAEVHDCFTIAEGLRVEGLGLCEPGTYFRELEESGRWTLEGAVPVNPSGGLLAKGHPLGATGVAQIVELVTQFRGEAGDRQVSADRVAVAHTRGGSVPGTEGGSCGVIVCTAS